MFAARVIAEIVMDKAFVQKENRYTITGDVGSATIITIKD